jgi:hypothetical protein
MVEKIVGGTYSYVHSILILKDNKLVFEEYFYEHRKTNFTNYVLLPKVLFQHSQELQLRKSI